MYTFLIQTVNGQIVHDFAFELLEAMRYHEWFYDKPQYEYILSEEPHRPIMPNKIQYYPLDQVIPIGTVDFVTNYIRQYYKKECKPLNIPQELQKPEYLKRWVKNVVVCHEPIVNTKTYPIFVKDTTKIKGFTNIINQGGTCPVGSYLMSECVDIEAEWRAFVHKTQLVGLQNYLGDFTTFPDVKLIENMINDFKDSPPAYTLDVGINKDGTFIIEVHNFFSCGLYGFRDYKILPAMFISAFAWQLER